MSKERRWLINPAAAGDFDAWLRSQIGETAFRCASKEGGSNYKSAWTSDGFRKMCIFAVGKIRKDNAMTTMELNAQIWRDIAEIADNETLMRQLAKYLKKLVAKKDDPTCMTKEEFLARVDEAKKGPSYELLPDEDLTTFLRRRGYDL